MSPSAALDSRIFLSYVGIAAALVAFGGIALGLLRWRSSRDIGPAWRSYRGWLAMVPVVLLSLFLGRAATIVFFTLVGLFGFKEYARATGLNRDRPMTGAVYLAIVATGIASLMHDPAQGSPGWYGLFMAMPVYAIATFLMLPIVRNRAQGQLQVVCLAILGFTYVGWMFGHLAFLANARHAYGYLLFLLFAVELNDVAAFVCGKLWGRHPLRSNISPKKTWEGSLGALAFSMCLPWALGFSFPHFTAVERVLTGLIVGVGGQLGDLSISFIKRDLGVKDMGAVLRGHGGILDRIDSLIYTAPLFLHMVHYFDGL